MEERNKNLFVLSVGISIVGKIHVGDKKMNCVSDKEVLPFTLKINEEMRHISGDLYNVCFLGKKVGDPLFLKEASSQMKRCNKGYKSIIEGILLYDGVRAAMAMRKT